MIGLSLRGSRRPYGTMFERRPGCWARTTCLSSISVWLYISIQSSTNCSSASGWLKTSAMKVQVSVAARTTMPVNAT